MAWRWRRIDVTFSACEREPWPRRRRRPCAGAVMTDAALLDSLAVVADLWHARLDDRIPFGLMPRDRVVHARARAGGARPVAVARDAAATAIASCPRCWSKSRRLSRFAAGQGDVSDQAIDVALRIADQAATGRPMLGPGPYPMMPPGAGYPPAGLSAAERQLSGIAARVRRPDRRAPLPPPGAMPPPPPSPPSGGPSPYELPPGYAGYAPAAQGAADRRDARRCASRRAPPDRLPTCCAPPNAGAGSRRGPAGPTQVHEALDWAAIYARLDRNCDGLDAVIDKIRELGSRTAIAGLTAEMTAPAERTERDRRWMRSQSICRLPTE